MRITNVREFRNKATAIFKQDEPIIITRHGKVVGLFLPLDGSDSLPVELRRELLTKFGEYISKSLEMKGVTEGEILEDFESFKKGRRRR
ncbi:MAG: type II toxin-antitoxin system Phd/YefM family antitoxin [Deltaproteobacteria bacterium]|nr:type II toxin-antitoxin system Phd/YefM family antitoxin [Deltaproteobacteria bacterium]MBW1796467.1 type II toxin-antitoxin system Phd/YefM family antitoxin [Deltaproteobacteria bacterium]